MIKKRTALVWGIILVILSCFATFVVTNVITVNLGERIVISKTDYSVFMEMKKLLSLKEYIKDNYVETVDENKLLDGATKGMFEVLGDPYSVYFTKKEFQDFNDSTSGSYGGIGIIVTEDEAGYVTVVAPIEDTPGERAGLKTGDKIVLVDDKDIKGLDLDAVVSLMKGAKGSKVKLSIMRDKITEPINFSITRDNIVMKAVKGKMMDNKMGYIRISMFDEDTGKEFKKVLDTLKNQNMTGLVLDLRQNPGGYVNQCVEVADELLDKGLVVYTEDKLKNREEFNSKDGKLEVPFVILVDGGSASASEILSGAVKDRKAGVLIGEKTFGKGLVQSVRQLNDGSGFKLTTQKYYTPNGISINKVGIEPDVVIKAIEPKPDQKVEEVKDNQLDKAVEVLKGLINK